MSLLARIARLEGGHKDRRRRCRWCAPLVIYPTTGPHGADDQVVLPPCEEPATCPGTGRAQVCLPERRPA